MGPGFVIVGKILSQGSAQRGFADDDHMVQTLAANRADHALHVGSLPRRPGSRQHLFDLQIGDLLAEIRAEDLVAIAQQIPGSDPQVDSFRVLNLWAGG